MSRNEVQETFSKYGLYEGNRITVFTESKEIEYFAKFISHCETVPFEFPDAYIKIDDDILIIEHFSIDGYDEHSNGGSKLRQREAMIDKEFLSYPYTPSGIHITRQIGEVNSYIGFIDNCKRRFDQHYSQVDSYKDNLRKYGIANDLTQFTICFLMDEVSPLGTLTHDGEKIRPVCLAQAREFLDFFSEKPNVDWIISAVFTSERLKPYFFSKNEIDICLKNTLDYSKFQFLPCNPLSANFKALIPNTKAP